MKKIILIAVMALVFVGCTVPGTTFIQELFEIYANPGEVIDIHFRSNTDGDVLQCKNVTYDIYAFQMVRTVDHSFSGVIPSDVYILEPAAEYTVNYFQCETFRDVWQNVGFVVVTNQDVDDLENLLTGTIPLEPPK